MSAAATLVGLAVAPLAAQQSAAWSVETPTGPSRSVSFEVTRGTWMSLSVSPDGRTLAFDLLGHIYELPVEGGTATRLTSGRSWNLFPRYSPDGRSIAFSSDRSGSHNVWIMDRRGGSLRHLAAPGENVYKPAWAADGRRLYAGSSADGMPDRLEAFVVTGGRQTLVQGGALSSPVAGSDGTVLFERAGGPLWPFGFNPYVTPSGGSRIESYDERTGETRIEIERPGGAFAPAPSPDGRYLAYLNRAIDTTVLILRDRATRSERVLRRGLDRDRQQSGTDYGPYSAMAWHPDGRRLFLATGGEILSLDVATGRATAVPFRAAVEREVSQTMRFPTTEPIERGATRLHRWGVRTPAGVISEALGDLWLADARGARTNLTRSAAHETSPVFHAPSGALYYAAWTDDSLGAVYRMATPGGPAERLTAVPAQYGAIAVSPDGKMIAYVRGAGGVERGLWLSNEVRFDLMVRLAAGGERRVTGIEGQSLEYANISGKVPPSVTFSPDGQTLYFTEFVRDTLTLKRIGVDGGGETVLIRFPNAVAAVPSPDLGWVAYREYQRSFLTPLLETGQPTLVSAFQSLGASARIDPEDGGYLVWSADGRTVGWSRGAGFYEKAVDTVLAEAGRPRASATPEAWNGPRVPGSTARRTDLSVEYEVDRPRSTLALTHARVITMNPARDVLESATILVENGRIAAVGTGVAVPAGAQVYDLRGRTVAPGFIDAHAHPHIEHSALHVIEQQPTYLSGPLAYGVTTVFEVYGNEYRDGWLADMARAGRIASPRFLTTGSVIFGSRHGFRLRMYRPIETLDDALEQLRWNRDHGATAVKDYAQTTRKRRHLTATAARILGLNTLSESMADPQMNFTQLVDGVTGIEHSMGLVPFHDDVVRFWGATGAGNTPTLLVVYGGSMGEGWYHQGGKLWEDPKLTRFVTPEHLMRVRNPAHLWPEDMTAWQMAAELRKLYANGTSLQVGAHGQMFGLDFHWELELLARGGFTPAQVLEMATIKGAAYHGLDAQLGSVEVGKLADLVVLGANPLEDVAHARQVELVVKHGVVYSGDDASRRWPAPRPAPRPYFARQP